MIKPDKSSDIHAKHFFVKQLVNLVYSNIDEHPERAKWFKDFGVTEIVNLESSIPYIDVHIEDYGDGVKTIESGYNNILKSHETTSIDQTIDFLLYTLEGNDIYNLFSCYQILTIGKCYMY